MLLLHLLFQPLPATTSQVRNTHDHCAKTIGGNTQIDLCVGAEMRTIWRAETERKTWGTSVHRALMVVCAVASLDFARSRSMLHRCCASACCVRSAVSSRSELLIIRWNSASYVLKHEQHGNKRTERGRRTHPRLPKRVFRAGESITYPQIFFRTVPRSMHCTDTCNGQMEQR